MFEHFSTVQDLFARRLVKVPPAVRKGKPVKGYTRMDPRAKEEKPTHAHALHDAVTAPSKHIHELNRPLKEHEKDADKIQARAKAKRTVELPHSALIEGAVGLPLKVRLGTIQMRPEPDIKGKSPMDQMLILRNHGLREWQRLTVMGKEPLGQEYFKYYLSKAKAIRKAMKKGKR